MTPRLPIVLSLMTLAVVAFITGCSGAHRYNSRLVAADSLMQANPDSALAIIEAVNPDSLTTPDDRAYRDLLRTQARYKCYADIIAGDDSAATRAITYYKQHSREREKLTRAYLYKGAVMEELGHPDSAMFFYKTAEAKADDKDYINLGQINIRIANLYRLNYGDEQTCYEKYKLAYDYYCLTDNEQLQFYSLYYMFMMVGITHHDRIENLYSKAINLATKLKDDEKIFDIYELRCRQLSRVDSSRHEAKQLALYCLNNYGQYINNDLLLDLAYLYAIENKIDSSRAFIRYVDESLNPEERQHISVRKYEVYSIIAKCEGKLDVCNSLIAESNTLSDSITNNTDKYGIEKIENLFNKHKDNNRLSQINRLKWLIISLLGIAFLVITLLVIANQRRLHNIKAIIKELNGTKLEHHDELLNQIEIKDGIIEQLITNMVALMKSCTNNELNKSTPTIAQQIKNTILNLVNDDFWTELKNHLDKKHHGIITRIALNPQITKKDLRLIELTCCGFSYLEIAIIMDYSPRYVLNKRKTIVHKMGIDMPLQEYLNGIMLE